jgi:1,2-dihydroxy-3-keto-5-methylthiopentene dioxygenase
MARITVPDEKRHFDDPQQVSEFLKPHGIVYERWGVERNLNDDPTNEEILEAYKPEIERLKKQGGYATADVINVTPSTPNLDMLINKFNKEHIHTDDEVRFMVKGAGLFHIHPKTGPVFSIRLEAGDLINVPAGTQHWFDFCEDRRTRAIRLFVDPAGWTPRYVNNGVHANYAPVCWGPAYIPAGGEPMKTTVAG